MQAPGFYNYGDSVFVTWVVLADIIIHIEPVIQGHQLEEGEARLCQVAIPVRVHMTIQPPADDCKDIWF